VTPRIAARVLVFDPIGAVLLLHGCDPGRRDAGDWWFTPGGGVDPGESLVDAARREVAEETGFRIDEPGPVVFERSTVFEFEGDQIAQHESFFVTRTARFAPDSRSWTALEHRSFLGHRWWTAAEIRASADTFYPENLLELVETHRP
jgi:8-oxo-dGTP pyrophosphatase MutT (NUDIX family)